MSRGKGFAIADVDVAKQGDPKVRALWRHLRDESAMNAAMVVHEAVLLASWAAGERVAAEDAAPAWMTDVEAPASALAHVGLLDDRGHIPLKSWRSWFVPAAERRQQTRDRWKRNKSEQRATSEDVPEDTAGRLALRTVRTVPSAPTVPTVRENGRARTIETFADAWKARHLGEPSRKQLDLLATLIDRHGNERMSGWLATMPTTIDTQSKAIEWLLMRESGPVSA